MRSLVAGATSPRPLRTRETVGADTPASAAMTEMVTSRDGLPATEPPSYPHRVRTLRTSDGGRASAFRTGAPRFHRKGVLTPSLTRIYCPFPPCYGSFRKFFGNLNR